MSISEKQRKNLEVIESWKFDVFKFSREALMVLPAEPLDRLKGKEFKVKDPYTDEVKIIKLFDLQGRLIYHDLSFYKMKYFKNQDKKDFKIQSRDAKKIIIDEGTEDERQIQVMYLTWHQTIEVTSYQRAIDTFDCDSYDISKRWITIRSGHGIGKTSFASIITIHFLTCFFNSQMGATANTDSQLKDIYLKEFHVWKKRLPIELGNQIEEQNDKIKIKGSKDWFLRARVSGKDNPESLAGLHGKYVVLFADEASGIWDKVFEVMQGALTGDNWIVIMTSNPTRSEGFFYDSHKQGSRFTKLHFNSEESPIVGSGFIEGIVDLYGQDSDQYRVRVLGKFPDEGEMDDKGWVPLFANVNIMFEPENGQVMNSCIMGVDPSGTGSDTSRITVRDSIYMKNVLTEKTSNSKDLARKIATVRDIYGIADGDIGIDAFGVGAKTVAEYKPTSVSGSIGAVLSDKPREGDEIYNSFKTEMAWKFREWVISGGIILTNNQKAWMRELSKIKYKRNQQGKVALMGKIEFKKLYGFSPDKFDSAIHTFFKDEPYRKHIMTKQDIEFKEHLDFVARTKTEPDGGNNSCM